MKDEMAVFVRIALYAAVGRLSAGGWLPDSIAAMVTSPETVEAATTVVIAAATLIWYRLSKARAALVDK